MRFYVIELQTDKEDKTSKAVYEYANYDEALKVFHQKMASGITAGLSGTVKKIVVMILDYDGNTTIKGTWDDSNSIAE